MLQMATFTWVRSVVVSICLVTIASLNFAQSMSNSGSISTAALRSEIGDFLAKEVAAHFADIKSLDPPPDRVFNALTTGDFSWGSFARALSAQSRASGIRQIA